MFLLNKKETQEINDFIYWTWITLYIIVAILSSASYRLAAILLSNLARAQAPVWAKFPILPFQIPDWPNTTIN